MPEETPVGARVRQAVRDLESLRGEVDVIKNAQADQERECLKHGYAEQELKRRLDDGAKRFSDIDHAIDHLSKEVAEARKPISVWKLLPFAIPAFVATLGVVWQAASYPDWTQMRGYVNERSPYLHDKARIMDVVDAYGDEMPGLRLKLGVIDYKLDTILKKLDGENGR